MSKEALERIRMAEHEAHSIVEKAEQSAELCFKQAEDRIFKEREAFYEKLKAERSEKLRRVDMQMKLSEEKARQEAAEKADSVRRGYEVYLSRAKEAAVNTVLE